ncbi:N-acetylated-alpha-linked acidic dipeptidase 2-like [Stylophora pistillata]|uniref:N-acetylated-alpha-linked acidic dipeptidase 2-like n=1 Tax=Stylophora pistillata TaxID=50429 RepID=UPI000C045081|nr:N-acetylated-alpha-linked acidic dipeptidase 2-like [Stylophora pistillata]
MVLSYGDAQEILRRMKGLKAPKSWRGGLQLTYCIGPGFKDKTLTLRVEVNNSLETKTIYNVIGQIRGTVEPDRYVLMGNHRDAWVFGAADPVSGTAVLMELSRGLGKLIGKGWRPRRTIMLCSWDAEESGAVGSTEWVEENAQILQNRAVAYLNIDQAVNGNFSLNVDASPLLKQLAVRLTKEICDPTVPDTCKSMYEVMLERDVTKHVNGCATCDDLSFGSDYGAFYHFLGISCADWSYIFGGRYNIRRAYPVYHSVHDTFYWMKTFVDPEFQTHLAVTKFAGAFLLKLSDSELLPLNTTTYGEVLQSKAVLLEKNATLRVHNISTAAFSRAVRSFAKVSHQFERGKLKEKPENYRILNDQMMQVEKAFIQTVEVNDWKLSRHVIYGLNDENLYGDLFFPRVHYAMIKAKKSGDWKLVEKEMSLLTHAITSAANVLKPI